MAAPSLATLPSIPTLPSPNAFAGRVSRGALKASANASVGTLEVQSEVQTLKEGRRSPFANAVSSHKSQSLNVGRSNRNVEDQYSRSVASDLIDSNSNLSNVGAKNPLTAQSKASQDSTSASSAQQSSGDQNSSNSSSQQFAQSNQAAAQAYSAQAAFDTRNGLGREISKKLSSGNENKGSTLSANNDKSSTSNVAEAGQNLTLKVQEKDGNQGKPSTLLEKDSDTINQKLNSERELRSNQTEELRQKEATKTEDAEIQAQTRIFDRAQNQVFQKLNQRKSIEEISSENKRTVRDAENQKYQEEREFKVAERLAEVEARDITDRAVSQRVQSLDQARRAEAAQVATADSQKRASQHQADLNAANVKESTKRAEAESNY